MTTKNTGNKSSELIEAELEIEERADEFELNEVELQMLKDDNPDDYDVVAEAVKNEKKAKAAHELARKKIDKEASENVLSERPTFGIVTAQINLHTRQAWNFSKGRRAKVVENNGKKKVKPAITGLFGCTKNLRLVEQGHVAGDPFATLIMMQFESEMKVFEKTLSTAVEFTKEDLSKKVTLKLDKFTSPKTYKTVGVFYSKYGYQLANYVTQFDDFARIVVAHLVTNLIEYKEAHAYLNKTEVALRRLLNLGNNYQFISPEACETKNEQYQAALEKYAVTEDFINTIIAENKKNKSF